MINIHHFSPTSTKIILIFLVWTIEVEQIAPKTTTSVTINRKIIDYKSFVRRSMLGLK